jgi:hypothetical protein
MVRYIFLVLGLTLFAQVGRSQSIPGNTGPERLKPLLNIQEQPGAPLKLTATTKWTSAPDQQMLEIYVVVENVSELEIRSYAWRLGTTTDGSQDNDACLLHNRLSFVKVLGPGESDGKSTWRRIPVDSPSPSLDLSLDYVEFANGSTWGSDTCKSGERLSGLRAGVLAARDKFAKVPTENRGKDVINLLKQDVAIIEVPDGHSSVWVEGFRDGVRGLFEKLRRANEEGGLPEVERVLQMPFDAPGK